MKRGTNSFQSHRCSRADGLDGGSAGRENRSSVGGQEHGSRHPQDHPVFGNRHERRRGPELRSRHRLAAFRDHELHQGHRLRQPGVQRGAHAPAGNLSTARRWRHAAARRTAAARRAERQLRLERAGHRHERRSRGSRVAATRHHHDAAWVPQGCPGAGSESDRLLAHEPASGPAGSKGDGGLVHGARQIQGQRRDYRSESRRVRPDLDREPGARRHDVRSPLYAVPGISAA